VRSFAHAGPGQAPAFALSNFARQVAEAQLAGVAEIEIRTGRKTTIRDLSDARDAARAYLAMAGARPSRSATFDGPVNVGSGVGRTTTDLVAAVAQAAGVAVDHVEDPALVRDGENPSIVADISLAREALGWRPETTLEQTAADAVAWWTATLRDDPARGSGVFG
jgi:GDP-4-dehydro-6-deoxy-D-mannose reductase